MNGNDNFNPLFPEEEEPETHETENSGFPVPEEKPSETEPDINYSQDFEPVKEVPFEDIEADAKQESAQEAFTSTNDIPEQEPFLKESYPLHGHADAKPEEESFNPYAQKNAGATNNNPFVYNENKPENNTYTNSTPKINPTYDQPVNNGFQQNGNNHNFNNGSFNNGSFVPNQQPPVPKDNKNGKIIITATIAICVIVALIALVSSFLSDKPDTNVTSEDGTTSSQVQENQTTTQQGLEISTTQAYDQNINSIWVAEKVRPVVVGVLGYQQGELAGEGSGVLMSEDLTKNCTYIVTCAHVINDPSCEFSVLLLDGTRYDAEVVALDERTDIGVLKIDRTGLQLAEIGDSSSLKFGEPVYAIGNPGGSEFFGSITDGIVSAIDRSISATYTMTCIQHNAAINPGNSGGALVNSAGQVIGINSSKIAKTDYEGMGFAVPSAIFKPVVEALIQYGYVPNRPELGIKYAAVSEYQLYSLIVSIKGLPKESIIIAEIPEGSALTGTQAQVGDLIIAVNGQKMDSSDVLLDLIDTGAVGDTLTLTLCRIENRSYEISTFDVTVTLVEDKGSITTTTQPATLPQQDDYYGDFGDFFDFFGW